MMECCCGMGFLQYGNVETSGVGIYSMTKTALLGLTKVLVPQLATLNIRINSVLPGPIDTNFFDGVRTMSVGSICYIVFSCVFLSEKRPHEYQNCLLLFWNIHSWLLMAGPNEMDMYVSSLYMTIWIHFIPSPGTCVCVQWMIRANYIVFVWHLYEPLNNNTVLKHFRNLSLE